MRITARNAPVEARRTGTLTLKTCRSRNGSVLAGELPNITAELTETQRFEAALYAARNAWDIARRSDPFFIPPTRLSKAEADAKLRAVLRQSIGGGRP
jgi:hypothetical protein